MHKALTLPTYQTTIASDWVDFNGHLRDGYYMVLFSYGVDGFMDHIGLDAAGRQESGHSMFTLEAHIHYLHEVKRGTPVEVRTQLLAHDAKRVHLALGLYAQGQSQLLAFSEQILLNVDMAGPRGSAFVPAVAARVQAVQALHAGLAWPQYVGHVIALPAASTAATGTTATP